MRIVLDIADDVLQAVEERAQRERKTIGELLCELVRPALTRPQSSVACIGTDGFFAAGERRFHTATELARGSKSLK
jgi:hypothetical protein